ncbi:MAG: endonuclease III domain-containing protein [Candidatus Omnitrophota bacterium]|nr:endonuclease III domain-containing protein [Candidatus Omnitrophota bacterium]
MRNTSNRSPYRALTKVYNKLYSFYGPQGWWPGDSRFEVIVGAILTQNTAWSNVEKAVRNLKAKGALASPVKMNALRRGELARLIRPSGYYNVKAARLHNFTSFLAERYSGRLGALAKVPTRRLRDELLAINGIGPETCDSILLYAFGRPVFVVDAYTRRVFSRHGLFIHDLPYESVQALFTENLPSDEKVFGEYHALIVRLAKGCCKTKPQCEKCPLSGIKLLAK